MSEATEINLQSEQFFANPYQTFARLRSEAPVYFFQPIQSFVLSRAADIEALLKNPCFSARRANELLAGIGLISEDAASKKMLAAWSRFALFQDAPRHTLLRQFIMKGFTPAAMERIRPRITAFTNQALEKARNVAHLVEERRKAPGEDLVSRFILEEAGNPDLTGDALIQSFHMVGGGLLTSVNQISNSVLALLQHPEELQKLREDPSLLKSALDECMRYEPSLLSLSRLCVADTEIHGTKISSGQFVFGMAASANRDPAVFPEPDRFDITRSRNRHMTFGVGSHYCPGAPLFRMELEEGIRALLTLPRWELGDEPYDYAGSNFQDRGPSALHVRFPRA
jgi:cytochrome P450